MTSDYTSRRDFIKGLWSSLAAIVSFCFVRSWSRDFLSANVGLQAAPHFGEPLLTSPSAVVVGQACLESTTCERDEATLANLVGVHRERGGTINAAAVWKRIQDDFDRGDTVSVNGWVLARTEARLYALSALTHR